MKNKIALLFIAISGFAFGAPNETLVYANDNTGGFIAYWRNNDIGSDGIVLWNNALKEEYTAPMSIFGAVAFSNNYNDLSNKPTSAKRKETFSGTTNASGVYAVTFSPAYSVAPNIQANIINGTDNQIIRITSITTTGFTVLVRLRTDIVGLLPTYSNVNNSGVDVLINEK